MTNFLWLQFPTRDGSKGELSGLPPIPPVLGLPPIPPVLEGGQVKVTIHAVLHFNPAEGAIASQAGTLMDVIAAMAKDAGCTAGRLDAMWDSE